MGHYHLVPTGAVSHDTFLVPTVVGDLVNNKLACVLFPAITSRGHLARCGLSDICKNFVQEDVGVQSTVGGFSRIVVLASAYAVILAYHELAWV